MGAELHFLGTVIDLFCIDTVYTKGFSKYQGVPVFYNQGGLLYFEFPYGKTYEILLERMLTIDYDLYKMGYPLDEGKVVFYDANGNILKTWKFKDAFIKHYKVKFDSNGIGMQVEMIISPAIQNYGCKIHRSWHITPIKEGTYQSPVYAVESNEQIKIFNKNKEPIIDLFYCVEFKNKIIHSGRTNKDGLTERTNIKKDKEKYIYYWGNEALLKAKKL